MNLAIVGLGGVAKSFLELIILKEEELLSQNIKINIKYILKSDGCLFNSKGIDIRELVNWIKLEKSIYNHKDWIGKIKGIEDVIKDESIHTVIELTSTNITNGEPGLTHIKLALNNNKNVITGNKGPIIFKYKELKRLAINNNLHLGIGCTTGGALPSINCGFYDLAGAKIELIQGILNGTSNYILSEMQEKNISYDEALAEAKRLNIAEANPSLDVGGFDTACKIIILGNALLDSNLTLENTKVEGITNITLDDIKKAKDQNKKIKLIGTIKNNNGNINAYVNIEYIDDNHPLYFVDYKNKGVYYKTDILGDISIIGGASSTLNAAASILRDLINIKNEVSYTRSM